MRLRGMRKKLYLLVYDKALLHRKALKIKKSIEEVKKLLGGSRCG